MQPPAVTGQLDRMIEKLVGGPGNWIPKVYFSYLKPLFGFCDDFRNPMISNISALCRVKTVSEKLEPGIGNRHDMMMCCASGVRTGSFLFNNAWDQLCSGWQKAKLICSYLPDLKRNPIKYAFPENEKSVLGYPKNPQNQLCPTKRIL